MTVVRQNNMFNDPTDAINELAALVKKDITDINAQLDNLQVPSIRSSTTLAVLATASVWLLTCIDTHHSHTRLLACAQEYVNSKRAASGSRQAATHSDAIVSLMKSNLMVTTKGFKDILEVRQENMKLQQNRRARYGKTASSALGKPLTFAAPPIANARNSTNGVNVAHALPRPDGTQSNDQLNSEIVPLIAPMSQAQVVAEQQNYTESRAEAVSQIESHIVDIGQMFGRLATILHEQEDLVRRYVRVDNQLMDTFVQQLHAMHELQLTQLFVCGNCCCNCNRIDDNVDDTLANVSAGENELLKYFASLSSNRMLALKVSAILFVFLVFFLFVLA